MPGAWTIQGDWWIIKERKRAGPIGKPPLLFCEAHSSYPLTNPPERALRVSCLRPTTRMGGRSIAGPITTLMGYGSRAIVRDQNTLGGPVLRHDDPVRLRRVAIRYEPECREHWGVSSVSGTGLDYFGEPEPSTLTKLAEDTGCMLKYGNRGKSRGGLLFCIRRLCPATVSFTCAFPNRIYCSFPPSPTCGLPPAPPE